MEQEVVMMGPEFFKNFISLTMEGFIEFRCDRHPSLRQDPFNIDLGFMLVEKCQIFFLLLSGLGIVAKYDYSIDDEVDHENDRHQYEMFCVADGLVTLEIESEIPANDSRSDYCHKSDEGGLGPEGFERLDSKRFFPLDVLSRQARFG